MNNKFYHSADLLDVVLGVHNLNFLKMFSKKDQYDDELYTGIYSFYIIVIWFLKSFTAAACMCIDSVLR